MTFQFEKKANDLFPEVFNDPKRVSQSEYHHLMELAGTVIQSMEDQGHSKQEIRDHLASSLEETSRLADSLAEQLKHGVDPNEDPLEDSSPSP